MSAHVGQHIRWRQGNRIRHGTVLSPALWSGTWWVHAKDSHEDDVYGCALLRHAAADGGWTAKGVRAELAQAQAVVALRAAGVAP